MGDTVHRASSARRLTRSLGVVVVAATLAGCVATTALKRADFQRPAAGAARVLIMAPDVQLSELTAAGLEQPNAQWTALGRRNVSAALDRLLAARSAARVPYREPAPGTEEAHAHVQLQKLHEAVGSAILVHKYNQAALLPTKADTFDWTLGRDAGALAQQFDADYALFLHLHDSYASGGRVAMIIAMAAFGVAVSGGVQRGFASLVDLRTGDLVWFNVLVRGSGDLRTEASANEAVSALLGEVPL